MVKLLCSQASLLTSRQGGIDNDAGNTKTELIDNLSGLENIFNDIGREGLEKSDRFHKSIF